MHEHETRYTYALQNSEEEERKRWVDCPIEIIEGGDLDDFIFSFSPESDISSR